MVGGSDIVVDGIDIELLGLLTRDGFLWRMIGMYYMDTEWS